MPDRYAWRIAGIATVEHLSGQGIEGTAARSWPGRLVPSWPLIVAFLAIGRALAQPRPLLPAPDPSLHSAAGRWMLAHGPLPIRDPFSYTFAGARWVPHEWLAEIVLAAVYRAAGWSGLVLLTIGCFAISLALLTRFLLRWAEPFSALIAVALAATLVESHLLARPHLLALPLLVLWSGALFAARDIGSAPPFRLLPMMVLWANLHDSYLFGLLLAFYLTAEAVLAGPRRIEARRWGLFAGIGARRRGAPGAVGAPLQQRGFRRLSGLSRHPNLYRWPHRAVRQRVPRPLG